MPSYKTLASFDADDTTISNMHYVQNDQRIQQIRGSPSSPLDYTLASFPFPISDEFEDSSISYSSAVRAAPAIVDSPPPIITHSFPLVSYLVLDPSPVCAASRRRAHSPGRVSSLGLNCLPNSTSQDLSSSPGRSSSLGPAPFVGRASVEQ
jgi:hypothetical protein